MRKLAIILTCLVIGILVTAQADNRFRIDQTFGGEVPVEGKTLTLKEAISGLEKGAEGLVKIEGQVTEVCQAKGCWMILVDGETYARVTFENYGFFVPIETNKDLSFSFI